MMQADLLADDGEPAVDRTFGTAKRTTLDPQSWVELIPGWLSGADKLFALPLSDVPWRQHHRRLFDRNVLEPRLTAEYRDVRAVPHRQPVDQR